MHPHEDAQELIRVEHVLAVLDTGLDDEVDAVIEHRFNRDVM